jgi:hypothetical protein
MCRNGTFVITTANGNIAFEIVAVLLTNLVLRVVYYRRVSPTFFGINTIYTPAVTVQSVIIT